MKTKGVVAIVLIAVGSLGVGYWIGQHARAAATSQFSTRSQRERPDADFKPSPSGTNAANVSTGSEEAKSSLAEVEEKLANSKEWIRDKEWEKIMGSVGAADFPGLV